MAGEVLVDAAQVGRGRGAQATATGIVATGWAIDPDTWRTAGFNEEDKHHFLDMDWEGYGKYPFAELPLKEDSISAGQTVAHAKPIWI